MANKMLIDAAHPEETRVVVLRGNRVEDFDFESASKKPLRGNIYLAKVTRVEPSLQAAFIEYGGNRHGFLAFSEIHPDYYQIPVADRQALLEEEARAHREEDDEQRPTAPRRSRRRRSNGHAGQPRRAGADGEETELENTEAHAEDIQSTDEPDSAFSTEPTHDGFEDTQSDPPAVIDLADESMKDSAEASSSASETVPVHLDSASEQDVDDPSHRDAIPAASHESPENRLVGDFETAELVTAESDTAASEDETVEQGDTGEGDENGVPRDEEVVEQLGGDALEDVPHRTPRLRKHYKIQEVIKRRQILLVQVVKEERGNKGAALTTYLSLAGRYSVLMPNTARGGGISRKITDSDDRKRLKAIAQELEVPEGMGIILRTAGAARGEQEVKRDFEYLLRMWETVRELTLRSSAPMLVYEEGSLIKRAIRDLYSKEIDEIQVAGEEGYREAKDFMRLLMPTHVRNVVPYRDSQPIFAKAGAEAQLDAMFSNHVTLKSGGYLVINQTEALVAIDVNSGRSTREHNIEDTALRTNLEAADEVARQLRLRDLAGLIVVDFIDMEEGRNNRAVERRIKDALKNDRARIQVGHISHFGLLEMSRQRIRTGVLEGSTVLCPHCAGAGTVRSTASIALHVLRVLEDHLIRSAAYNLIVRTRMEVALYILNQKRAHLNDLESRFGVSITVMCDTSLTGTVYHAIERGEAATPVAVPKSKSPALGSNEAVEDQDFDDVEGDEDVASDEVVEAFGEAVAVDQDASHGTDDDQEGSDRRKRRRRRRRGRDRDVRSGQPIDADADQPSDSGMETMARIGGDLPHEPIEESDVEAETQVSDFRSSPATYEEADVDAAPVAEVVSPAFIEEEVKEPAAPRRRRSRRATPSAAAIAETPEAIDAEAAPAAPRRSRRSRSRVVEEAPSLDLDLPAKASPSADRDIEAVTARSQPASAEDTMAEPATSNAPLPIEPTTPVAPPTQAAPAPEPQDNEPPRPKRSGWWQRAKATITGE
ncbi:Rne/Rng family ribonuclease [Lichenifustis flavocetrariae]|uniref:Ribonuclease E n=1 Tax=Lichenifustis flavocetrariae TaxID=2949735 RepID=A0AA41YUK1_9HYPH|nr:Rne/Rng family ribonuclease [Lichenifustis flavocetrariae]MCW6507153.1 Rne/Rng family ribonuclease [Lichenifustis flavocetrariae]